MIPEWVNTDFVRSLNLSGTGLKAYGASIGGIKTWMLKSKRKIYKDRYGWITAQWYIHPEVKGNEWTVKSVLGFSPATNGSFANEKIIEFREADLISGKPESGMMGWQNYVIAVEPKGDNADRQIEKLIAAHGKDLKEAKKFWKKALVEAKKQFGLVSSEESDMHPAKELLKIAKELIGSGRQSSRVEGPTSLDGMTKVTAKNNVNRLLSRYSKGFFTDDSWKPVNTIWKAMNAAAINWVMTGSQYRENDEGLPSSKEWKFEVYFDDKNGRHKTLYGIIIASGAGSVSDPLSRYDLVAYVS